MRSQKYICWTRKQMRYMLGDHGFSYVVGFNRKFPLRPHDRGASCPSAPANCTQVTALYNPQPNPHTLNGALVQVGHHNCSINAAALAGLPAGLLFSSPLHALVSMLCTSQPPVTFLLQWRRWQVWGGARLMRTLMRISKVPLELTKTLCMGQDARTWDFYDDTRASNDTWVSIDSNAGFTGAVAGLNQVTGTYDQCLQGYGMFARDKAICDTTIQ